MKLIVIATNSSIYVNCIVNAISVNVENAKNYVLVVWQIVNASLESASVPSNQSTMRIGQKRLKNAMRLGSILKFVNDSVQPNIIPKIINKKRHQDRR